MYKKIKKLKELKDGTDVDSEDLEDDNKITKSSGKGLGLGQNNLSMFKVMIFLFKMAGVMAVVLIIVGFVMSLIEFFSITTGTAVQIADGSIISYGEPTPGPEDGKKKAGSGKYSGDETYMKAKMIVEACINNKENRKKVNNISVPNGTYKIVRNTLTGKRGGIYHAIEVEYIFKELENNNYMQKYELVDGTKVKVGSKYLWAEFIQENTAGSGYEANWDTSSLEKDSWLYAYKLSSVSGSFRGAFQVGQGYFDNYKVFVPNLEKDNGEEFGLIKTPSDALKDKMKYQKDLRAKGKSNFSSTDGYHFTDMSAMAAFGLRFQANTTASEYHTFEKLLKDHGKDINDPDMQDAVTTLLADWAHRGPGFYQFSYSNKKVSFKNSHIPQKKSGAVAAALMVDGLLTESELSKIKFTNNHQSYEKALPDCEKLIAISQSKDTLKLGFNYIEACKNARTPNNPDLGWTMYKVIWAHQINQEMTTLVDIAFDKLGLVLPVSGGTSLQLKETPGEFQGFWSNKKGKTLTSDQMKTYSSSGNYMGYNVIKEVGKKNADKLSKAYTNDPFTKKFGDNVGVIWYHQSISGGNWNKWISHSGAGSDNTLPKSFCGGYSTCIVLSTMLHRYINPAELLYAAHSYGDRHSTSDLPWQGGGGKMLTETQAALLKEQRYKNKPMFSVTNTDSFTQTKVDSTLDAGGMVIGCFKNPIATGTGHFVVIRARKGKAGSTSARYFTSDPSHNNVTEKQINHEFKFEKLKKLSKGQVNYVKPAAGYKAYIQDNSSSGSLSSGVAGKFSDLGNGWYGYLGTDQYYPYWLQGRKVGTKPRSPGVDWCPLRSSNGCFIFSLSKFAKMMGESGGCSKVFHKSVDASSTSCSHGGENHSVGNFSDAKITTVYSNRFSGVEQIKSGSTVGSKLKDSKDMKKVAKQCLKWMKQGKMIILEIDYKSGGNSTGGDHFVNVCASNGKKIKVWDSGASGVTNIDISKFVQHYGNPKVARYVLLTPKK